MNGGRASFEAALDVFECAVVVFLKDVVAAVFERMCSRVPGIRR